MKFNLFKHLSQLARNNPPDCAGFLFVFEAQRRAHSWLCNRSCNAQDRQKDKQGGGLFIASWLTIALLVLSVSACGRVKSYFPDKTKDYQFTSEIPELKVPADLSSHTTSTNTEISANYPTQSKPQPVETVNAETTEKKADDIYVELIEYSGGATRIRIEDNMEKIWRTVGKALSRHSIEIIDRNELDRVYFVQYDANFEKVKDDSLWDEVIFIFGSDPAREEEFRIKLVEYGGFIEIIVLNNNDIPLSTGNGLKLLKLLFKTIRQDLGNWK